MTATHRHADSVTREERLRFLRHTHDSLDQQIRTSNYKASYLLATVGAVFVGCGAALLGPEVQGVWDRVLLVVGLLLCAVSAAAACAVVLPVGGQRGKARRSLMFFGSITAMEPDEYAEAVRNLTEEEMIEELSHQIYALSRVTVEKLHWVRVSTMVLAPALVILFGAFIAIFMK